MWKRLPIPDKKWEKSRVAVEIYYWFEPVEWYHLPFVAALEDARETPPDGFNTR